MNVLSINFSILFILQWQGLADAARLKSCFWRFVLLQLSVIRADILSDSTGIEMAEIEALLEEAAELVDESQPKNPNYYRYLFYLKEAANLNISKLS